MLADGMIIHSGNPNRINQTLLLELESDYSKIVGYKANIQKSSAFLDSRKEKWAFEFKTMIPFTLAPKI